jgi:hypothetical protein
MYLWHKNFILFHWETAWTAQDYNVGIAFLSKFSAPLIKIDKSNDPKAVSFPRARFDELGNENYIVSRRCHPSMSEKSNKNALLRAFGSLLPNIIKSVLKRVHDIIVEILAANNGLFVSIFNDIVDKLDFILD